MALDKHKNPDFMSPGVEVMPSNDDQFLNFCDGGEILMIVAHIKNRLSYVICSSTLWSSRALALGAQRKKIRLSYKLSSLFLQIVLHNDIRCIKNTVFFASRVLVQQQSLKNPITVCTNIWNCTMEPRSRRNFFHVNANLPL